MKFSDVQAMVGETPFISPTNANYLYQFILRERPKRILELGIAHGTATCHMAAALQELGCGKITCVDLIDAAAEFQPTPEQQLALTGLESFVEIIRMKTGYTWFLHDNIRKNTKNDNCEPEYDLCVIDGSKNWTIDGGAFFMVDKLLKPGGWVVFDDYSWTYGAADATRDSTDGISHRVLSEDELSIPHIREVFELLVVQHPNYSNFIRLPQSDWVLAQKIPGSAKKYSVVRQFEDTYANLATRIAYRIADLLGFKSR